MRNIVSALIMLSPTMVSAQSYYPSPALRQESDPNASAWHQPAPFAHEAQVDEGASDDSAHRTDRTYTAYLNRRPIVGWNQTSAGPSRADAAEYAREMQAYQADRAEYARNMAAWRADLGYAAKVVARPRCGLISDSKCRHRVATSTSPRPRMPIAI